MVALPSAVAQEVEVPASMCGYFKVMVLPKGTSVAIPGQYGRETKCPTFLLHRLDLERFYVFQEQEESQLKHIELLEQENADLKVPKFWDSIEGKVTIAAIAFMAGAGVAIGIFYAAR